MQKGQVGNYMEITRHFTATTYIVFENKVLLHFHKKLGIWVAVGGHIDRDELPEAAAAREAKEETGLEIELFWADKLRHLEKDELSKPFVRPLNRPVHLLLENINDYHQHIDFIYYAKAYNDKLNPRQGETDRLSWFAKEDLNKTYLQQNVKLFSLEALYLLSDSKLTY